jgi:carbamoyl-phosphate synthase large subunit
MTNILMTGAGAPGAPGIIRCLQQDPSLHITVADADEEAAGRYLVPDFVQLPKGDDPHFAESLLAICREKNIQLVLPLVTRELAALSTQKKKFEDEGIRVLISSPEAIEKANNKAAAYLFLQQQGIALPDFRVVRTVEEFIRAASELGHPQRAFCFKPSVSNGSRGVRIVSDAPDEASLLFSEKPYQLQISYARALDILSGRPFPELLLSDYLPGEEFSVDCLADQGRAMLVVPRIRYKMINGISVKGRFLKDEAVMSYCTQIIESIGLHGNIGIQVRYSQENQPLLLEINPRLQGTTVAALGAGINFPLLAVKQELGRECAPAAWQVKWGTNFARYWTEVFY